MTQEFPEVDFYVGQVDPDLSNQGFILPGWVQIDTFTNIQLTSVGDMGDRLFGTLEF